jgi:hypothetical protein
VSVRLVIGWLLHDRRHNSFTTPKQNLEPTLNVDFLLSVGHF